MKKLLKLFMHTAIACSLLMVVGCSKTTQANFDKIHPGMSKTEVTKILGQPTEIKAVSIGGISGSSAVWKNKDKTITILFINDQVKIKSLTDDKSMKVQASDAKPDTSTDAPSDDSSQDSN